MDCCYNIACKKILHEGRLVTVYGVTVTYKENGILKSRTIHDISPNKLAVETLITLCNEHKLEVCHLDDVVEDFLTSQVNNHID